MWRRLNGTISCTADAVQQQAMITVDVEQLPLRLYLPTVGWSAALTSVELKPA
jgi:hypothetical protein